VTPWFRSLAEETAVPLSGSTTAWHTLHGDIRSPHDSSSTAPTGLRQTRIGSSSDQLSSSGPLSGAGCTHYGMRLQTRCNDSEVTSFHSESGGLIRFNFQVRRLTRDKG
jgi:hypothetical protein